MTTPHNLVLYYATISGLSTASGTSPPTKIASSTTKPQHGKKDRQGDRFPTPPVEIPLVDLHGHEYWDTHTHVDQILRKFNMPMESFPEFKEKYFKNGFGGCVTVCCDLGAFKTTKKLLAFENVYGAFGIHPHHANKYSDEVEKQIIEAMRLPKTVAWGEMGLDYHYDFSERQVQREVFARQLQRAVEANKPIVVHSREAEEDTILIMREIVPKDWRIHVHCFTDSVAMAETLIAEWPNCFIGITGAVTFGTADRVREVVRVMPLDRLLLETDGPFMAPMPFRGAVCHSGHIPWVAMKISEVKRVSVDEVLLATRANTKRMYGV